MTGGRLSRRRLISFFAAPLFFQGFAEEVFDLSVYTSEFILCPSFQFGQHLRVQPQQEAFLFCHKGGRGLRAWGRRATDECFTSAATLPQALSPTLLIKRTGVNHRADVFLAAEYDKQVTDHRSFAFFVERDHIVFGQAGQGHLDHANGAIDNLFTSRDYC